MNAGQRLRGLAAVLLAAAWAISPTVAAQPSPPAASPPAPADPAPEPSPEMTGLRSAFLSGAPDELVRAGQRLSARNLADALSGVDRELALAAAGAAPSAADAIWLLAPLAELTRSPDRPLAAAAARSAARIAGDLDIDALLGGDVPLDWVRARLVEFRTQAADATRWTDVRVSSLEVAAHLRRALADRAAATDAAFDLAAVLGDPDPEMRRAALELTSGPLEAEQIRLIAGRVAADDDRAVVAAAGQALCDGLAFGDAAQPVMTALGSRGLERLRKLVVDGDQPDAARAAVARCLAADDSSKSREALRDAGDLERGPDEAADGEAGGDKR